MLRLNLYIIIMHNIIECFKTTAGAPSNAAVPLYAIIVAVVASVITGVAVSDTTVVVVACLFKRSKNGV